LPTDDSLTCGTTTAFVAGLSCKCFQHILLARLTLCSWCSGVCRSFLSSHDLVIKLICVLPSQSARLCRMQNCCITVVWNLKLLNRSTLNLVGGGGRGNYVLDLTPRLIYVHFGWEQKMLIFSTTFGKKRHSPFPQCKTSAITPVL